MTIEANKALQQQWIHVISAGDLDGAMALLSPDFVSHAPGMAPGPEGVRQFFEMQSAAFPDHKVTTLLVVADETYVTHHMRSEGTHTGHFLFLPPSGKYLTWEFIDIFRIENGRFVEHWVESDTLGMMQQIGMIPGPRG
jgi:predicted ester cyclase